jgi:hypothetical protein
MKLESMHRASFASRAEISALTFLSVFRAKIYLKKLSRNAVLIMGGVGHWPQISQRFGKAL